MRSIYFLLPVYVFLLSMKQEQPNIARAAVDKHLSVRLKDATECGETPEFKKQKDGSWLYGPGLHVDEKIVEPAGISENAGNTVREAFGFSVAKGDVLNSVRFKKIKCYGCLVSETEGVQFLYKESCAPKESLLVETSFKELPKGKDGYYHITRKLVKDSVINKPPADLKQLKSCYLKKTGSTYLSQHKVHLLDYAYVFELNITTAGQPKIYTLIFHLFYREC